MAARKSRVDRRKKELEILNIKSSYEDENMQLKQFVENIENENQCLLYQLALLREEKGYPSKF